MGYNRKDRRAFLKKLGLLSGAASLNVPVQSLILNMMGGMISHAHAQTATASTKTFVQFTLNGAPSRWMFDQMLTPYGSSGFISNASVATRYTGNGRYTAPSYSTVTRTIAGETLNLPWMWQFDIPARNNSTRPMTDLLLNFLSIRGIDTGNAAHDGSQRLLHRPLGATRGIASTQADESARPIPAYFDGDSSTFNTLTGKSFVNVSRGGNRIQKLMEPFLSSGTGNYHSKKAQLTGEIQNAMSLLDDFIKAQHPGAQSLTDSRRGVEDIVSLGLTNLDSQWNSLYTKYAQLVSRSLAGTFEGINDLPIGKSSNRDGDPFYQLRQDNEYMGDIDIRTMVNSNTQSRRIAEQFALAEYLLVNKLTNTITLNLGGLENLSINGSNSGQGFDEHNSGVMPTILRNFFCFRAMGACLLEFIEQCKDIGVYNETLIAFGGEFNRSALADGSGSDHGDNATSFSYFSGMMDGPLIIGNCHHGRSTGNYAGSWGEAAPSGSFGILNMSHIAASVASVLEIPTPTNAAPSVLSLNAGGKIVPRIPRATQVPR